MEVQAVSTNEMTINEFTHALHSPETVFLMSDDGEVIAGRNKEENWRLIAKLNPALNVYSIRMSFSNNVQRYAQVLIGKSFLDLVQKRLNRI